jgi:hypothetical protein
MKKDIDIKKKVTENVEDFAKNFLKIQSIPRKQ